MKQITRTILTTTIQGATCKVENGEIITTPLKAITRIGTIDEKKAHKELKKEFPNETNIIIMGLSETETKYAMSLDAFIKGAQIVPNDENSDEE